jgi:hypothetical protein
MAADYNELNNQFQQLLGRPITQDEWQYLGKFVNDGHLQTNEIGQIIQSMPEFQQKQLDRNATDYGDVLNKQNSAILDQAAAATNSQFARLGRPNSSAMGAAVARAGGQLAQQRQSALAAFYGGGLQQNQGLQTGMGQNALSRGYGLRDESRQRGYQIEDYYRQKNDAADYEKAHSGWNAITPEFAVNQAIRGGMAFATGGGSEIARGLGGMFGGGGGESQLRNINQYGPVGGWRGR